MTDDQINSLLTDIATIAKFVTGIMTVQQDTIVSLPTPIDPFILLSQKVTIELWKQQLGEEKFAAIEAEINTGQTS